MGWLSAGRPCWLGVSLLGGALLLGACGSGSADEREVLSATAEPATATVVIPETLPSGEAPSRWGYHPGRETGERDPPPTFSALPVGYLIETFAAGLQQPTSMAFTPDGRLLVAEQGGAVRVVENGILQPNPFFTAPVFLPEAENEIVELGLVGIAVDPDFERNGYVYVYYTTDQPARRTVLGRLQDVGGQGKKLEEVLSLDAAPKCCHIAGSLRFAPDGTLFVNVGDHQMETDAQDPATPFGSILRINSDGSAAAGNPFEGDASADPRVYAYGLRNPFDLAIDSLSGRIFATENGFLGQDAVIEVKPGANYGWPGYELSVPLDEVEAPLLFYHQSIGPSGIELYRGDALPVLDGSLLFCQFHQGGALHAVTFDLDGSVAEDSIIALGCTSDVLAGPDGLVYFLDYVSGVIYRISRDVDGTP